MTINTKCDREIKHTPVNVSKMPNFGFKAIGGFRLKKHAGLIV